MLTDARCRSAQPQEKPYKLSDSEGLYLLVSPTGFKSWRWKYRIGKTEKKLGLGPYPNVSLKAARELRDEAARLKRQGLDPALELKRQADERAAKTEDTFEVLARAWHTNKLATWSEKHAAVVMASLQDDAFCKTSAKGLWSGEFGQLPIREITAPMVLEVVRAVEARGAIDGAHRLRQRMSDVFVFAIADGKAKDDPAGTVKKALKPVVKGRYPALRSIEDARELLRVTEAAPAHPLTKLASRLLAITAARSGPLRHAEPAEFEHLDDPARAQWRIPAEKMKLGLEDKKDEAFEFIIPLPWQAIEIVKAALKLAGRGPLLFPGTRHAHRPMSENAISTMYKRFPEFRGRHVPHGWRSTFSTIMNELAVAENRRGDREIIDLMLAHKPEGVEAIYNRAAYMPRRREIAQEWADMLIQDLQPAAELLEGRRK